MSLANNSIPFYHQILESIASKIETGQYKYGEAIPSEMELCSFYNVSRSTIQKSLSTLVENGILTRVKGKGTFVTQIKISQKFTTSLVNYNKEMRSKSLTPHTKVLLKEEINATEELSEKLNIPINSPVIRVVRLRFSDATPLVYVDTYLPLAKTSFILDTDLETYSLYETFEKNSIYVHHAKRNLEIRKASAKLLELLEIASNIPLFYFESQVYDRNECIVEYSKSYYRGDVSKFEINTFME